MKCSVPPAPFSPFAGATTSFQAWPSQIAPDAMALLLRYDWPGNARELQHAVERAVILTTGGVLTMASFDAIRAAISGRRPTPSALRAVPEAGAVVLPGLNLEDAELALIERALAITGGNRTRAAELLGISDRTLRNKLSRQRTATPER